MKVNMFKWFKFNPNVNGLMKHKNVICTGVTASAALEVLPNATVVALAMSSWR